ncbi:HU family DNA-binding protein [Porphyromonas gingivalis]|uniref:HU family DNA-binding protein n=1 Tax=Porphyromonas gingivalis TaxID=837 RepID=UPI00265894B0|nr:HU family DNA-binding protein [Porphyromonas gingivalis]MDP0531627.1 HU family DNA-binding protein [Porphyromonas gingivalis]MDP0624642.1 HU family DNA-binding protein [Porphyromonas gingivalis]WKD51819.1 HU family DNA-binding protein [Porphyromonas gingivalis]WKD53869.1 HU family DNA-binding protein [Porphyromonas gingivalis]
MAIFYNKMQRKNPAQPAARAKWYPVLRRIEMMKEKQVARHISDETTLNPKEAEMAVSQLKKVLIAALLNGQSVQLGDWGTFYLTLNSNGVDTEAEVSATQVKKINIRFRVGKELQEAINKAQLRDAASISK